MDGTVGKVYPVHNNIFKFGTKGQESLDENMAMPSDLENFSPSIDGTVEEWYAMDAAGWAKAAMTGKKLSFSFKGKRSVGDAGNDYIAGLAWKFGQDVMTKFEWTMVSGAKLSGIVVINVTTRAAAILQIWIRWSLRRYSMENRHSRRQQHYKEE